MSERVNHLPTRPKKDITNHPFSKFNLIGKQTPYSRMRLEAAGSRASCVIAALGSPAATESQAQFTWTGDRAGCVISRAWCKMKM